MGVIHVNLKAFATRLLRGACTCVCVGDSINADGGTATPMLYGYIRKFTPTAWAGLIDSCGANVDVGGTVALVPPQYDVVGAGGPGAGHGGNTLGGVTANVDGDGGAIAGERNLWPTVYNNARFTTASGGLANGAPLINCKLAAARRAVFRGGDWFTGTGMCRTVVYRGSVSWASMGTSMFRGGVYYAPGAIAPIALNAGYNYIDTPCGAGSGDLECYPGADFSGTNEAGKTMYCMGFRYKADGVTGLTLGCVGLGGATVADLINTNIVSDAAIAAYVNAFGVDTIILWIGTNDATIDATWYANLLTLIQRWRTAIGASFKCLLVSPYDVGNSQHDNIAAYATQACQGHSDVSFLDLRALAGTFAFLNASYLTDGVHPNAAGANYLAGLMNTTLVGSLNTNQTFPWQYYD